MRYGRAAISSSLYHINQAVAAAALPSARGAAPPPPQFRARRRFLGVVRGGVARSILRAASHVCAAALRGRRLVAAALAVSPPALGFVGGVVRGRLEIARAAARAAQRVRG